MMFKDKNIFNSSFDVFADNYHSARPGYPIKLYREIKELCEIDNSSQLLEIGAGSGIATAELAKFGCRIVALEPGAHLAEIARRQTGESKNVEVLKKTFEDFESPEQFDAILAFTAYHWLDERMKYQKVLGLLDDSGYLVIVWNSFFLSDSEVMAEVNRAYCEYLPGLYPEESSVEQTNEGVLSKLRRREQEVVQSSPLCTIALRKYYTLYNYDAETYPKLLNTFPKIVKVEDKQRQKFFARISEIVGRYGTISVPVLTTLIICKKKSDFLHVISHPTGG